jgi:hypothetical protein
VTIKLKAAHEEIIREALRRGRFRSVEEALDHAMQSIAPPLGGGRRSPAEAAARLRELRKGTVLPPAATIRSLIEHGRA